MRHLIDTYIEAKEPRTISAFGETGLIDLIVKSGMADAINSLPEGIKANKDAVAETITNNVRSKIIKEHLNDPAFYDRMSALLQEILADLKAARIDYEEFLKRIATQVVQPLHAGKADDTPATLDTPGKRALYSNLKQAQPRSDHAAGVNDAVGVYEGDGDRALERALRIHESVKKRRPHGWRGVHAKEQIIKGALYDVLQDDAEVERLFLIVWAQTEY
jgi:type I restriction enzyme R subunit